MIDFKQTRGLNFRKFSLTSNKVLVETRSLRKNERYEVRLDKVGFNIYYQADNIVPGIIMFWLCLAIVVFATAAHFIGWGPNTSGLISIWVIAGGFSLMNYLKQHQDDIYLTGGEINLVFYRNKPDEHAVLNFIEEVKKQARLYLKEKFAVFDSTTDEKDFYSRIQWLKDQEIINQKEFDKYKEDFERQRLL